MGIPLAKTGVTELSNWLSTSSYPILGTSPAVSNKMLASS